MFIFLDDLRTSPKIVHNSNRGIGTELGDSDKWTIIRNYQDFIEFVNSNFEKIEFISFDHDIDSWDSQGDELTGKDAADWLIEFCMDNQKKLPDWFVHSDNTSGNKNIRQLLANYMFRFENRISKMEDIYGYFNGKLIYTK